MEIWKSCKFSDEITSGNLDVSKFAVELHNILDGDADKSYLDPKSFLDNTYLTESMKIILKDSLLRLKDGKGQPVHVLDTSFGGGKTHSLVLLYHIFTNKDLGTKYISKYAFKKQFNIESVPDAAMVCIDCRRITTNESCLPKDASCRNVCFGYGSRLYNRRHSISTCGWWIYIIYCSKPMVG